MLQFHRITLIHDTSLLILLTCRFLLFPPRHFRKIAHIPLFSFHTPVCSLLACFICLFFSIFFHNKNISHFSKYFPLQWRGRLDLYTNKVIATSILFYLFTSLDYFPVIFDCRRIQFDLWIWKKKTLIQSLKDEEKQRMWKDKNQPI